jgi:hypothetical protein
MSEIDHDRELGMGREITRRDFLNGVSIAVGTSLVATNPTWLEAFGVPQSPFAPEKDPGYYPPAKTGMRGAHDGSWEVAHSLRDGQHWPDSVDDGESYDLVIVGAGISGLAAAYFIASSPDSNPKFFFSTTTMISADTPNATNFSREREHYWDTVERNPSKRPAITAKNQSVY